METRTPDNRHGVRQTLRIRCEIQTRMTAPMVATTMPSINPLGPGIPSALNIHPPTKPPTRPSMRSPINPKPAPCTSLPASQPAIIPTMIQ